MFDSVNELRRSWFYTVNDLAISVYAPPKNQSSDMNQAVTKILNNHTYKNKVLLMKIVIVSSVYSQIPPPLFGKLAFVQVCRSTWNNQLVLD